IIVILFTKRTYTHFQNTITDYRNSRNLVLRIITNEQRQYTIGVDCKLYYFNVNVTLLRE
ncbi:MAG: hypothetical protein ACK45C_05785, partial [Bacteroidota bacterium]